MVDANGGNPRVSMLKTQVSLESLAHFIPKTLPATEVLRLSAPCAGGDCAHFRNACCTLASRIVAQLPVVADRLGPCPVRSSCRWWRQEGIAACQRCPQIVTTPFQTDAVTREVATPPPHATL